MLMKTLKQLLKNFGGWKMCLIPVITSKAFNSSNSLKKDLLNFVDSLFVELWNMAKYFFLLKAVGF